MEDYSAKLTAEPFLYNETKTIAKFLLDGEEEEKLRKRNIEENLIKYKSPKSIVRVNSPIFRRLDAMDKEMLEDFVYSDIENSKHILLYAIMKIMQDSGLVIKEKTRFKIVRPLLKEKYISMLDKNGDLEYAKAIGGLL